MNKAIKDHLVVGAPATPAALCKQQQQWADKREERSHPGFLAKLLNLKTPPNTGYADAVAGGYLEIIASFLNGTDGRPESTVSNVAAVALYPDIHQVLDMLEMEYDTLPEQHRMGMGAELIGHYTIDKEQKINRVTASLRQFFADKPPTAESVEVVSSYIKKYQQAKFLPPVPGDLWLTTPESKKPVRALPRSLYRAGAHSNNKVVLGGAGSGRSVMMGQLSRAAHEDNRQVVMIAMRQRKQAMYHFTEKAGGTTREFSTRSQASFNPFWFPEGITGPRGKLLYYLADLLVCLLQTASPQAEQWGKQSGRRVPYHYLSSLLNRYYQQQPWEGSTGPSFQNFYDFASGEPGKTWAEAQYPLLDLLAWLSEAGKPFYVGGKLAYLLSARPEQATEMFTAKNRLLYFEMKIGYAGNELSGPIATPCIIWLLLFGIDVHLSYPKRDFREGYPPVTVAVDELLDECLNELGAGFMESYMRTGRHYGRELVCSWHTRPEEIFRVENKVAHLIRDNAACLILLAPSVWYTTPEVNKVLWLSDSLTARLDKAQGYEVVISGPGVYNGRFFGRMSPEELAAFEA